MEIWPTGMNYEQQTVPTTYAKGGKKQYPRQENGRHNSKQHAR
jgi:hypothetical protein